MAFDGLHRHAEAVTDLERAVELADHEVLRTDLHCLHAAALAMAGDRERATQRADWLVKAHPSSAKVLFNAACVHALCRKALTEARQVPEDERTRLSRDHLTRALELLDEALNACASPEDLARLRRLLQEEQALSTLRVEREAEFRQLLHRAEPKQGKR